MNFKNLYLLGQPQTLRYSYEIFPPKDEQGTASLFEALRNLSEFDPSFISVTYGAMGSTRDLTRDLAIRIGKELKLTTAFHFTCVGADKNSIQNYVQGLKSEGLNLVVALRGDSPMGQSFVPAPNGFSYANELVAYLKEIDGFSMAVAGYPEGHIESTDKEADLKNLKRKVDAGADIVITQMFYDNADYFDFLDRARKIGITVPIIPGIMPILNLKQIEKITKLCGARLPEKLHAELKQHQESPDDMREIGIQHAIRQCRELAKNGVPGIHFYTLNRAYSTRKVIEGLV